MLGFVLQLLIERQFGLSTELDAFNAANNLPDLIFGLISGGALAVALIPVLSQYIQEIGTLIGVLFLAPTSGYQIGPISLPTLGLGVYGLTYGTILGALLFLAVQIPGLVRYRFHWIPRIDLRSPGLRQVLRLMGPRVATMFFIYMALIYIPDNLASSLPEGSVTALVYGWLIMQVPETLIGTAIGTALLPTVSEQVVRGEVKTFARSINHSLRVILALTLPAADSRRPGDVAGSR